MSAPPNTEAALQTYTLGYVPNGIPEHGPQNHTRGNARGDSHNNSNSNNNNDVMQRFNSVLLHDGFVDDDRPE